MVYISRKQQMLPVFESGLYVISVHFLRFLHSFPCIDQDSDLSLKVLSLVLFLFRFRYVGLFCIFLFQSFFTPLMLSWDRKHRTTTVILYILSWPFFLFQFLQVSRAVNPFYRCLSLFCFLWRGKSLIRGEKRRTRTETHLSTSFFFLNIYIDLHVWSSAFFFLTQHNVGVTCQACLPLLLGLSAAVSGLPVLVP